MVYVRALATFATAWPSLQDEDFELQSHDLAAKPATAADWFELSVLFVACASIHAR